MAFLFGPRCEVGIQFDKAEKRKKVEVPKTSSTKEFLYLFHGKENVKGKVVVRPKSRIEHKGIKISLLGVIEMVYDTGTPFEFVTVDVDLSPPGVLETDTEFPFDFVKVNKKYESYMGINVQCRYFLRFDIEVKNSLANVRKELGFWVHNYQVVPEINSGIKMEVGIEDCLHIEFEYNRSKYHLKDVVIGKIFFLLVRIKIKHMELSLIKRETTGRGPSQFNENETVIKYEIMDGAPVKGECVPVRLFLCGFDLTPTYRSVQKKFSVKYYLNLVLVDEEQRRYFKQQEITLWRKK